VLSAEASRPGAGFAVVDVETTGSSSRRHRVVELAVVLLDGEHRVEGEFATLVDPEGPVGPTHIHGIAPEDLRRAGEPAPRFGQIAGRLLTLLRGRVLVGHNVGCDHAFLAAEYGRLGVRLPVLPQLCTMRLAERFLGPLDGLSLRACAAAAGVPRWVEHTALGDARAAGALFTRCVRTAGADLVAPAGVSARAAALEWPGLPRTGCDGAWKINEVRRSMVSGHGRGGA
jgi:DNA polymerase-3 subunit epsilon